MITLHHAHSAKRFGQPSTDLGVDLAALPKDRTYSFERSLQSSGEENEAGESKQRHGDADAEQDHEGDHRGKQPAGKLDQSCADQVAHAFNVIHDARDQRAGLVGIVISHWKASNMRLHLLPQLRNESLRRLR